MKSVPDIAEEFSFLDEYKAKQQNSQDYRFNPGVGADIAKKAHVARDVRGVELGKPLTFDNSRHEFEKLLTWIWSLILDHSCDNVVFGVEPTGHRDPGHGQAYLSPYPG